MNLLQIFEINRKTCVRMSWLIKPENNFLISKTHEGVGFLIQNITLLWNLFLIGWTISDIQLFFYIRDLCQNIPWYQTIETYNVNFSRYLASKITKSAFFMTGTPLDYFLLLISLSWDERHTFYQPRQRPQGGIIYYNQGNFFRRDRFDCATSDEP